MLTNATQKQNTSLNFKSHDFKTTCTNQAGQPQINNHYTYLGRDLEESFMLRELIRDTFPRGTKILNPACSTGAESYAMAMLLGNNPKYPIVASDISSEAIEAAKKGIFPIARQKLENGITYHDSYLNHNTPPESITSPFERTFRALFERHFRPTEEKSPAQTSAISYDSYVASDAIRKNISFSVGDVEKIDPTQKAGVIIDKNAWSYLFGNEKGEIRVADNAEQLFKRVAAVAQKFAQILPQDGILSAGDCPYDYLVKDKNNQFLKSSPLTDIFKKNGLEPIEESTKRVSLQGFSLQIPTLWRKL